MWNSYIKWGRLNKAMRRRGLDPRKFSLSDLADVLEKRGVTDHQMNGVVWGVIGLLEPPPCYMTHCKNYGHSSASCNCAIDKVPGRCKIYRDYKKRQKKKDASK